MASILLPNTLARSVWAILCLCHPLHVEHLWLWLQAMKQVMKAGGSAGGMWVQNLSLSKISKLCFQSPHLTADEVKQSYRASSITWLFKPLVGITTDINICLLASDIAERHVDFQTPVADMPQFTKPLQKTQIVVWEDQYWTLPSSFLLLTASITLCGGTSFRPCIFISSTSVEL